MSWLRRKQELLLFVVSGSLLAAGALAWLREAEAAADACWVAGTVLGLIASVGWTVAALRQREATVDVIALLALAGALLVDEPFAGAVITVMLASGRLLEALAAARARRELSMLAQRAPRIARRIESGGPVEIPADQVAVGDRLLVGSGEVLPTDGRLATPAIVDESALTGEPLPAEYPAGEPVRSGAVNAGGPLEMVATAAAADSTYAGVVRMVEQAQASSAPFVRLADRTAVAFVPLTLALAALAWAWSGDPVRAVGVLVVATPCPLLLAAPIAIMSGLSRTARQGVIVKGGGALERLARGRVMLFDKTGTLTRGRPLLFGVATAPGVSQSDVLRLAASLDQVSPHILASALVSAAAQRGLDLLPPSDVVEVHGYGLRGTVDGHEVRLGKAAWIVDGEHPAWLRQARRRADLDGSMTVFAGIDGRPAGVLLLADQIRPDAPRMIRALRGAGIERIVLVTGDRADIAESVGRIVGVDAVLADCDPGDKLRAIREESAGAATIMVGDGINDAPALAAAGVGVALAARGATASSQAADVVLTVERLDALAGAVRTAQRARRIAGQAVGVGMGLSLLAMFAAALGRLPPAAGALLQEAIDLLAIAIALRAVLPGRRRGAVMTGGDIAVARRLRVQHDAVLDVVEQCRTVADGLSEEQPRLAPARDLLRRIDTELLPHERAEEAQLVPLLERTLGTHEAGVAISRTHAEIEHQSARLHRMLADLDEEDVEPEDVVELRRMLYGLYAVLQLHNAQEEEGAFSLVPAEGRGAA